MVAGSSRTTQEGCCCDGHECGDGDRRRIISLLHAAEKKNNACKKRNPPPPPHLLLTTTTTRQRQARTTTTTTYPPALRVVADACWLCRRASSARRATRPLLLRTAGSWGRPATARGRTNRLRPPPRGRAPASDPCMHPALTFSPRRPFAASVNPSKLSCKVEMASSDGPPPSKVSIPLFLCNAFWQPARNIFWRVSKSVHVPSSHLQVTRRASTYENTHDWSKVRRNIRIQRSS